LLQALAVYPANRNPASDGEKVYRAALLLAAGQVAAAETLLDGIQSHPSLIRALRKLILTVKGQATNRTERPASATEYLVEAYYLQSIGELEGALEAARAVTRISPSFGFGWARVAELEFGFARMDAAARAVDVALELSPRNAQALALKGFFLAAKESNRAALRYFNRAIAIDGGLGNAWLGRGLVQIHLGHGHEGRADLQVAATLEPQRALLRSYLGKAFSHTADNTRALKELNLAKRLDPNDPTAWLYSALILQKQNRINEAITDLEKSKDLNNNRRLWRSNLLLDQDRAVRAANLASIYRDAGMTEVSVWEASRAVNYDYGNFSAHLFLANSYDALRDPKQINLRYETPWLSELLTANLLAPAGAGNLSQNISQQEYSRLFESDHLGISSSTEYYSSGDWVQRGSQYGYFGKTSYAFDGFYRSENGQRPNNDLEQRSISVKLKHELTPRDSLFFRYWNYDAESGDLTQYYDQTNANRTLRVDEEQDVNLLAGYHRQWAPGSHSLLLVGWFKDQVEARDTDPSLVWLRTDGGGSVVGVEDPRVSSLGFTAYAFTNRTEFDALSAEFQQIWQTPDHVTILGLRGQLGWAESFNGLQEQTVPTVLALDRFETEMDRLTAYGYHQWQVRDSLRLTVGLSYDRLHYPENLLVVPITDDEATDYHLSPKAGLLWSPWKNAYFRLAYTRSLGGVFFDNSIRLEPSQVAGFNQAFRSVLPESAAGLVPASEFETFHAGLDYMAPTRTYIGLEGEILRSDAVRTIGVLTNEPFFPFLPDFTSSTKQSLEFEERSALLSVNQLLGDEWAIGARYRVTRAELETRFKEVSPAALNSRQDVNATLHQVRFYLLFHHPTGIFAQADSVWSHQSNDGYTPARPDEDFWQFNVFVGYRFLRRQAEARIGLLNITDQDYRLNPLTLYSELPRERTLAASFRFYF
jgi:tetratricopeptide (TPR) repeat protein